MAIADVGKAPAEDVLGLDAEHRKVLLDRIHALVSEEVKRLGPDKTTVSLTQLKDAVYEWFQAEDERIFAIYTIGFMIGVYQSRPKEPMIFVEDANNNNAGIGG